MQDKKLAPVSIVFPYHAEAGSILTTLKMISSQTRMPKEVIFVNSSSPDHCSDVINKWIDENQANYQTKFLNIFKGTDTPASSKNAGIDQATSDYVGFMDCGLLFPENWIESHFEIIEKNQAKFVSGQCLFKGDSLIDSCSMAQTYGYKRKRPTVPSSIVHMEVIKKAGKFLENRRAGYDAIWPTQVVTSGFERFVNEDVTVSYNGVNFAPSLLAIMRKSELYAIPTVSLPFYYVPYYYLAILAFGVLLLFVNLKAFLVLAVLYCLGRGLLIPILKSKNLLILKEQPLSFFTLILIGLIMDIGRVKGIIKGVIKYHFCGQSR